MQAKGIDEFRAAIVELAPFLQDRIGELRDRTDLRLLTVRVNRLWHWHRPGLVCIGDAAHATSPVGGVGINLAMQDAVAAANMLACRLLNRVTAVGIRPEHVRTPDVSLAQAGPATHNPKCERSDAGLTGVNSSFIFNAAGNTNAKIGALTGERGPRVVTLEMRAAF
jgi:2-polyprenyl-6-methoxyphenol hydroxylase-like FAD-dependent oxidoreductase